MFKTRNNSFGLLTPLVLTALVGLCCTPRDAPAPPGQQQELLQQRVEELLRLRVAGRYDLAYDFLDPSYRRIVESKQFEKADRVRVLDATLIDVAIGGSTAEVRIRQVSEDPISETPRESTITETWTFEDGQWYLEPSAN